MERIKRRSNESGSALLIFILLVALALRFYKCWLLNFTHDELSAMSRVYFDNFHDLIEKGVKIDFHPAGVQVFMHLWVGLFGSAEFVVKLPFLLIGMASVYLVYRIGELWYNRTCGLLSAALFAVFQYSIYYSQVARPYCSGTFFMLVTVLGWTMFLFDSKHRINRKGLVLYSLGICLCAYNHYFSTVSAVLVGVSGLFFLNRKTFWPYIFGSLAGVLLYLPHLSVTLFQLSKGGVGGADGWLSKPQPGFLFDYLFYITHYSWLFASTILLVIVGSFFYNEANPKIRNFRFLGFSWFIITFCLGYFYSVYLNPVLQYSVLIFVFPFLLISIFSFHAKMPYKLVVLTVLLWTITGSYTLAKNRRHYEMMFNQPYNFFGKTSTEILKTYPNQSYLAACNTLNYIMQPTADKFPSFKFLPKDSLTDFKAFQERIDLEKPGILILENIDASWVETLKNHYPYCVRRYFGFGVEYYALTKFKPAKNEQLDPYYSAKWDLKNSKFIVSNDHIKTDSISKTSLFEFVPELEYGFGFNSTPAEIQLKQVSNLTATVNFKTDSTFVNGVLVLSIDHNGQNLYWAGSDLKPFNTKPGKWNVASIAIPMQDANKFPADAKVSFYIWNKDHQRFLIKDFEIKVYAGNEKVYGVNQRFKNQ